jgi:hypothetical protein
MRSQAETLPPEIWLYIFTFFEGHDLVHTFSHLNTFFDSLLRSQHLQLHIQFRQNESSAQLSQLIVPHIDLQNIYSVPLGQRKSNCLIQFLRWHAQHLIRLHSLSIYLKISNLYNNIQLLTFAVQQIPSLHRIHLECRAFSYDCFRVAPVTMHIFREKSTIIHCSLIFSKKSNCDLITSNWFINLNPKHFYITKVSWN